MDQSKLEENKANSSILEKPHNLIEAGKHTARAKPSKTRKRQNRKIKRGKRAFAE